jgi:hypothetical protein
MTQLNDKDIDGYLPLFLEEPLFWTKESPGPDKQLTQSEDKVQTKTAADKLESITRPEFKGQNRKGILILVQEEKESIIAPAALSFLLKIFKACKLELEDVAIVNKAKCTIDTATLETLFHAKQVICFGVPETTSTVALATNAATPTLQCPAISVLEPNQELKQALWQVLKSWYLN